MVCRRFWGNSEKFHFNPIPLNKESREVFPNIQTLFIYFDDDEQFLNDERIMKRINPFRSVYGLSIEQIQQLQQMEVNSLLVTMKFMQLQLQILFNILTNSLTGQAWFLMSLVNF